MRLDHLLARRVLAEPLTPEDRRRAQVLLATHGFASTPGAFVLDDLFPWVTVTPTDDGFHVAVTEGLPAHCFDAAVEAFEEIARALDLRRLDPLTRREIDPLDWAARVASASKETLRGGGRVF